MPLLYSFAAREESLTLGRSAAKLYHSKETFASNTGQRLEQQMAVDIAQLRITLLDMISPFSRTFPSVIVVPRLMYRRDLSDLS